MGTQLHDREDGSRESIRLDKWLWAARFFKTRGLAQQAIEAGRVLVEGQRVKVARVLRVGERLTIRVADLEQQLVVLGLSDRRGPAPVARELYSETAESVARREEAARLRRIAPDPAWSIEQGRPTKRDRRQIERLKGQS